MTDQPQGAALTAAHTENLHLTLAVAVPSHEPRESDSHYHIFNETRRRLEKLGALKCWIGNADCQGAIELHHDKAEFSLIADIDPAKFGEAYGAHFASDEDFLNYVEGEGNLLALCVFHHRSIGGIHSLPYPFWVVQKYLKEGVAAPARVVEHTSPSPAVVVVTDPDQAAAVLEAAVPHIAEGAPTA
jgi:hypothetical protein